jgi:ribonuclease P protein component
MRESRAASIRRLTKRTDFVAAASGRRFHTERMTVQGRLRGQDGLGLRFGLTVTKKVGHATERNRIKRRLRTAVATAARGHAAADVDVVVIGRRDLLTAGFDEIVADLGRALAVVTRSKSRADARAPGASPLSNDGERRGTTHA